PETGRRTMSEPRDLPRRAKILILSTVAVGLAAVVFRSPDIANWSTKDLISWAGLVAASAVFEQFTIKIRHRTETLNFLLDDALWVGALMIARTSLLTMSAPVGVIVGQ